MTRSTLRCAAGILLAVTLLLPGMAAAREIPSGRPAEPVFSLARLWMALVQALPDGWTAAVASDEGDNGWQLDPKGKPAPGANGDNGWQIDRTASAGGRGCTVWQPRFLSSETLS